MPLKNEYTNVINIYYKFRKEKMSNYTVIIDRKNLYSKDYTKKKVTSNKMDKNIKINKSLVNIFIHMSEKYN